MGSSYMELRVKWGPQRWHITYLLLMEYSSLFPSLTWPKPVRYFIWEANWFIWINRYAHWGVDFYQFKLSSALKLCVNYLEPVFPDPSHFSNSILSWVIELISCLPYALTEWDAWNFIMELTYWWFQLFKVDDILSFTMSSNFTDGNDINFE